MVLEICGNFLTCIQTGLELRMGDVASDDNCSLEVNAGAYRVFGKLSSYGVDSLVEVYFYALGAFTGTTIFLGNKLGRIDVHLLNPHAVCIDLTLDIAVCRATDAHSDRAACTVAWETDDPDVMGEIFSAELSSKPDFLSLLQEFLLEVDVAEGTAGLIACCRERIIELDAGELDCQKVLLRTGTSDHEGDMIRRTSSCTKRTHLLDKERKEGPLILNRRLGHRIEISLIRTSASLCNHNEPILIPLGSLDIDLGREIALGVDLVIHVERGILAVAEILFCESIENSETQGLFVLEIGPDSLAFLAMDNGSTGILAERKYSLYGSLCIAKELEGDIFIVLTCFGVTENSSHLLVMSTAEHEFAVVEGLLSDQRQGLRRYLENSAAAEIGGLYKLF